MQDTHTPDEAAQRLAEQVRDGMLARDRAAQGLGLRITDIAPGAARMVTRRASTNRASSAESSCPSNRSVPRRSTGSPAATIGSGPSPARSSSTSPARGA